MVQDKAINDLSRQIVSNLESDVFIPEVNSIEDVLMNMGVRAPLAYGTNEPFTKEGMDAYCRLQGILMFLQDKGIITNLDFDLMDELSGFVFDKEQ